MKKIRRLLCCILTLIMVLFWFEKVPVAVQAEETEPEEPAGWYLTDYYLVINTKKTTGTFSQGGSYSDIINIFNAEGSEMQGLKSDFENDIKLLYGRYNESNAFLCGYHQAISWDSPEDYYAQGTVINLTGISNLEVSHEAWGCRAISARFNLKTVKDTYDYKFVSSGGSDQFGIGTQDITIKTEKAIPKAVRGDTAYLIINFDSSTSADSQAVYTYVWKAPTIKIKEKVHKPQAGKKGWYLTGYRYEDIKTAYYESNFSDGSLCIDTITVYDGNGDLTDNKSPENDLYIYKERYIGAPDNFCIGVRYEVKWDSPADYIAAGTKLAFTNFSNQVIASTDVWGAATLHTYAQTAGFNTEISDAGGNSWPGATEPITLTSGAAFPEGIAGQNITVYFEICSIGKAIYTYTWMTGESVKPSVTNPKVTLYLGGSNKKPTCKLNLKNAEGYTVTYKSRKASVATINADGVITAKKAGNANITVTFKGRGKTYVNTVKVLVKKK